MIDDHALDDTAVLYNKLLMNLNIFGVYLSVHVLTLHIRIHTDRANMVHVVHNLKIQLTYH